MAEPRKDPLPVTLEEVDHQLGQCAVALPDLTDRSRRLMLRRVDKLLDRRLLLAARDDDRAAIAA